MFIFETEKKLFGVAQFPGICPGANITLFYHHMFNQISVVLMKTNKLMILS